jgi:hypothetical protein
MIGLQSHSRQEAAMDAVIEDILKHGWAAWPLYLAMLVLSAVGGALGAYAGAYLKKRGETLATKHDFEALADQLAANTALTEDIKADVASGSLVEKSEFEHRKQQLEQFYGPIYAYLKRGGGLYAIWREGRLAEVNDQVLRLFRDQNDAIARIITEKAHLIEGAAMPPVFQRFMTSAALFNLYTKRPGAIAGPLTSAIPEAKWPDDFEAYIFGTTEALKKDLDRLHREFSLAARR